MKKMKKKMTTEHETEDQHEHEHENENENEHESENEHELPGRRRRMTTCAGLGRLATSFFRILNSECKQTTTATT